MLGVILGAAWLSLLLGEFSRRASYGGGVAVLGALVAYWAYGYGLAQGVSDPVAFAGAWSILGVVALWFPAWGAKWLSYFS